MHGRSQNFVNMNEFSKFTFAEDGDGIILSKDENTEQSNQTEVLSPCTDKDDTIRKTRQTPNFNKLDELNQININIIESSAQNDEKKRSSTGVQAKKTDTEHKFIDESHRNKSHTDIQLNKKEQNSQKLFPN